MTEWRKLTKEEKERYKNNKPKDPSKNILAVILYFWRAIFIISSVAVIFEVYDAIKVKNYFQLSILLAIPMLYLFFWKIPDVVFKRLRSDNKDLENDMVFVKDVIIVGARCERVLHSLEGRHNTYKYKYYATILHLENGVQVQSEVPTVSYIYEHYVSGMEAYAMHFQSDTVLPIYVVDKEFYGAIKPIT